MTDRCSAEWETDWEDEDGDGEAEHWCGLPDGHPGEAHWCYAHFACAPVFGAPSYFFGD